MPTNLKLDDKLIELAKSLGNHRTKKEAVTVALQEYVQRLQQREALAVFATIDFQSKFDEKRNRRSV